MATNQKTPKKIKAEKRDIAVRVGEAATKLNEILERAAELGVTTEITTIPVDDTVITHDLRPGQSKILAINFPTRKKYPQVITKCF